VGEVEALEDGLEDLVVEDESGGDPVGGLGGLFLGGEVEDAGVVLVVGLEAEGVNEVVVDVGLLGEVQEPLVGLEAAVFGHAQEDDAVNGALDGGVEVVGGEGGVAQGEVAGEAFAPSLDLAEELGVHLGGAALALGGGVLVEGAGPDGVAGEDVPQLAPAVGVLVAGEVEGARGGGFVAGAGPGGAVVDGELLEVREDGDGDLAAPPVAAELEGGGGVGGEVDAAFLGLDVELGRGADAEGVVGGALLALDVEAVLRDDLAVLRGDEGGVAQVPAEGLEEGVNEGLTDVGLLGARPAVGVAVLGEELANLRGLVAALFKSLSHAAPPLSVRGPRD